MAAEAREQVSRKTPDQARRTAHFRSIFSDRRGAALLEFVFAVPILLTFIIGIAQLGTFFFANSGLKSAVAEGARYATIFPRPTNEQVSAHIMSSRFGLDPTRVTAPTVTDCVVDTRPCITITMSYSAPLDFIFVQSSPITLVETRRVFVQR